VSAQNAEKNAPRQHPRGHQTTHSSEEMLFSSNESLSSPHRASENPQHSRRAKISLSLLSPLFPPEMRAHTRDERKTHFAQKMSIPKIDFFERPPERDVIQSTALTSTSSKDHLPKSFTSCVASSAILFVVVMLSRVTFPFF